MGHIRSGDDCFAVDGDCICYSPRILYFHPSTEYMYKMDSCMVRGYSRQGTGVAGSGLGMRVGC
jgi:hypothetical protein